MKPREPCKGLTGTGNALSHPTPGTGAAKETTGPQASSSSRLNSAPDCRSLPSGPSTPGHVGGKPAVSSPSIPVSSTGRICCGAGGRLCGLKGRRLAGGLSALVTALWPGRFNESGQYQRQPGGWWPHPPSPSSMIAAGSQFLPGCSFWTNSGELQASWRKRPKGFLFTPVPSEGSSAK